MTESRLVVAWVRSGGTDWEVALGNFGAAGSKEEMESRKIEYTSLVFKDTIPVKVLRSLNLDAM